MNPARPLLFPAAAALVLGLSALASNPAIHAAQPAPERSPGPNVRPDGATPVLVELFTSEGCSSCPPADTLLARLDHDQPVAGADIIVLSEHVDYWDSLGWRDRFSSHQLTERQSAYARRLALDSPYTPQMIVDGTAEFNGSDSATALRAITRAARAPKLTLTLSPIALDADRIATTVSLASPASPSVDLYAVLVESMASTSVLRGENGGRTLHHAAVVRSFTKIGSQGSAAPSPLRLSLPLPPSTSPANLRLILFAQQSGQGPITAALAVPLPNTAAARQQAGR